MGTNFHIRHVLLTSILCYTHILTLFFWFLSAIFLRYLFWQHHPDGWLSNSFRLLHRSARSVALSNVDRVSTTTSSFSAEYYRNKNGKKEKQNRGLCRLKSLRWKTHDDDNGQVGKGQAVDPATTAGRESTSTYQPLLRLLPAYRSSFVQPKSW